MLLVCFLVVCSLGKGLVDAQGQRIAPGVPPQHYQQAHNHAGQQQMHQQAPPPQQQQQFHQQIPVQPVQPGQPIQQQHHHQQQPPMQQQQQQQQQQQATHDHAHNPQQLLNTANIERERAHIAEHIDVPSLDTSKMTDQELQFHYFKMHDADNNNKLDGCELIKSLIHWHAEQGHAEAGAPSPGEKLFSDEELTKLIDPILGMDDVNRDGFIDYPEFIQAQQKASATGRQ